MNNIQLNSVQDIQTVSNQLSLGAAEMGVAALAEMRNQGISDSVAVISVKATPHKARLTTLHVIDLYPKGTSFGRIFSVISHKNSLTDDSLPTDFLCNLTKNLTAFLPHNLCAVLP